MVSNGRRASGAGCLSSTAMGNAHSGMQQQRGISEKSFYYWLRKMRSQAAEAVAPHLVQLEPIPQTEDMLQIQYRGAELKLPAGVGLDAVAALLRSIQSL